MTRMMRMMRTTLLPSFALLLVTVAPRVLITQAAIATPMVAPDTVHIHAPPRPEEQPPLVIDAFGTLRLRSEWDKPLARMPSDLFTLMRSRAGVRVGVGPQARVLLEVQDSRVLGANSASAQQTFALYQGIVELTGATRNADVRFRAGRQEIALANERLMGAVGWSNTGRTFDALRLGVEVHGAENGAHPTSTRLTADAFLATVEERGRHFGVSGNTAPQSDHTLAGVYVTNGKKAHSLLIELTALVDVGSDYRSYHNANRGTIDMRFVMPAEQGLRFELEGAVQRGTQDVLVGDLRTPQSVRAWLGGMRIATVPQGKRHVSFGIGADLLSGDASPTDGVYSAFNTLYGTNHAFYGTIDLFLDPAKTTRDRGLRDVFVTSSVDLAPSLTLRADLHHMHLMTGSDRALGWELDITAPVRLNDQVTLDWGYSAFRTGPGAQAIGLGGRDRLQHWAFVQMRTAFGR